MPSESGIRPAATVVVMRDSAAGPEVFLVRRHHAAAFMAGACVFPGGRVDAEDHEADAGWCDGIDEARAAAGTGEGGEAALAFRVAAARELFEEAGVLLARRRARELVALDDADEQIALRRLRQEVHSRQRTFRSAVSETGLRLALDLLVPLAHWVTPPVDVRRFDTRFFVVRVPPRQSPVHDEHESTLSAWMTPRDALHEAERQAILLPPPTWATLRELERFATVDAALRWARERTIRRREPKLMEEAGTRTLVLPGDPLHAEPEPVPFETRFVWAGDRWRPERRP